MSRAPPIFWWNPIAQELLTLFQSNLHDIIFAPQCHIVKMDEIGVQPPPMYLNVKFHLILSLYRHILIIFDYIVLSLNGWPFIANIGQSVSYVNEIQWGSFPGNNESSFIKCVKSSPCCLSNNIFSNGTGTVLVLV